MKLSSFSYTDHALYYPHLQGLVFQRQKSISLFCLVEDTTPGLIVPSYGRTWSKKAAMFSRISTPSYDNEHLHCCLHGFLCVPQTADMGMVSSSAAKKVPVLAWVF